MQVNLETEQFDVLEYLSRLQRKTVDQLAAEIVEEYLTNNYADVARENEPELGLADSVILTKGGRFSSKSRDVMDVNLAALRRPQIDTLFREVYATALKDAKPAWLEAADLIIKKASWTVAAKVEYLKDILPDLNAREVGQLRRSLARI